MSIKHSEKSASKLAQSRTLARVKGRNALRQVLECGDMSPLSDWQTSLTVPKRGHACALQIGTPHRTKELTLRGERTSLCGFVLS